jgi:transposase
MKDFMTGSTRYKLKGQHRKERARRVAERIRVVFLSDKGWGYVPIAEALMLDDETISRHVDDMSEEKLKPENGENSPKLNERQREELIAHWEIETDVEVSEICQYVQQKYGILYTAPGMARWLKTNGFAYKKPAATPAKADPEIQEIFIQSYEKLLRTTPENEPILFGDGVPPHHGDQNNLWMDAHRHTKAPCNPGFTDTYQPDGCLWI